MKIHSTPGNSVAPLETGEEEREKAAVELWLII